MRFVAFALLTVVFFIGALVAWGAIIVLTGGAITECDRGDCGTLGELTYETQPLTLIAALAVALVLSWAVTLRRSPRS